MGYFLLAVLVILWLIGAAITVKADGMLVQSQTDWWSIFPAMFSWPLIAILICVSKHRIVITYSEDDEYVY